MEKLDCDKIEQWLTLNPQVPTRTTSLPTWVAVRFSQSDKETAKFKAWLHNDVAEILRSICKKFP